MNDARFSIIQVRDLTGDGLVTKRRIQNGIGEFPIDCPIEDACVIVHYRLVPFQSRVDEAELEADYLIDRARIYILIVIYIYVLGLIY